MKKRVIVTYNDGGKLIYRGYHDKDDNYFLTYPRFNDEVVKVTRQYYPLKDNDEIILFKNK